MAKNSTSSEVKLPMEPLAFEVAYRVCAAEEAAATFAPGAGSSSDGLEKPALQNGRGRVGGQLFFPADLNPETVGDAPENRYDSGPIAAAVSFDGELLELRVETHAALVLESCSVTLRHAFSSDELVLLNGYQSWTDTREMSPWARMRGLRGIPSRIVDRFVLDGSGDYAMADYSLHRGRQHGFSYASFRRGESMVLVGSLDETRGFTLIGIEASKGEVSLSTECPRRVLEAGRAFVLGRYAIVRGSMGECYDRWFELSGIRARTVKPVTGYTSWYRHYGDIDERKLEDDLAGAASFFSTVSAAVTDGVLKLFQVDDGYCKVGDWLEVDAHAFPKGLAPLARSIRDKGFLPGIWLAPFVCEKESRLFKEHPEWLLKDGKGDPVPTGDHWSRGYALDTRNTEVRSYVLEVLQTFTREWGFGLLKLDFLYSACMLEHAGLNRGELMADAMELLRKGAGDDVLLIGCGVPLASAFGLVDYCRIGCDVGLDWDDLPFMRFQNRERVSTKNSLGNTYGRAPLDGRAFGNDPDVFFLRNDVHLNKEKRNELLFTDADLGHVLLTSDDMGAWTHQMRERYLQAMSVLSERYRTRQRERGARD